MTAVATFRTIVEDGAGRPAELPAIRDAPI
jgi:hypothetical protein